MSEKKVRWGIIGCGNIATHAIAPAILQSRNGYLQAIASRDGDRARRKAEELGAVAGIEGYEALVAHEGIDAVYIGLPNGHHEEWALKCAAAGKHVLCEKSLSLGSASAARIAETFARGGLRLQEAFMYRHHPQWQRVHGLIAEGAIGKVRSMRAGLSGTITSLGDHRWYAALGGGALFDVTCYGVNVARYVLQAEPLLVTALANTATPEGVDHTSAAVLYFPQGILAVVDGSLKSASDQHCEIIGSEGRIVVERPFIPSTEPTRIHLLADKGNKVLEVPGANHFLLQVEHFAACVLDPGRSLWPGEPGTGNVVVLEAIRRSWEGQRTVRLGD